MSTHVPSSLELAYLGDSVCDLFVRRRLLETGGRMKDLHRAAVKQVCAHAQCEALSRVEELLDEEEAAVVRRARNARQTPTGHADPAEYRRATAFEALVGYLYWQGRNERLQQILRAALPA